MTDTSILAAKGALLDGPGKARAAEAPMIVHVAKDFGISYLRQMRDIFSMRGGVQKLAGPEYYSLRPVDPAKTKMDKRAFLGQAGVNAINAAMNPPIAVPTRAFVGNKLLYTQLLTQLGIASACTQPIDAFAAWVMGRYPGGFLFQLRLIRMPLWPRLRVPRLAVCLS